MKQKYETIIIGAGFGGLNAAIKLGKAKREALIIDLRSNGGGRVIEGQCMMSLFLNNGSLAFSKHYLDGEEPEHIRVRIGGLVPSCESDRNCAQTMFKDLPLVVLVNAGSASMSEISSIGLQVNDSTSINSIPVQI